MVTPAMRRIEAEDPERHLAGLEHRLKERYRIEEKVTHDIEKRGVSAAEAFATMKDAIRYTFCHPDDRYADGVSADCERLKAAGFELADSRNLVAARRVQRVQLLVASAREWPIV